MANHTVNDSLSFDMISSDGLNDIEFSNVDYSQIMSFLEDSNIQESEGERLRTVVQSLEAEIGSHDVSFKTNSVNYLEDYQFSDVEQLDSCSTSPADYSDFQWNDMETMYGSLGDETNAYFADSFVDVENLMEANYAHIWYDEMPMEEDSYSSLWQ